MYSAATILVASSIEISEPKTKAAMQVQAMTLPLPQLTSEFVCFIS